eukprot:CAMPEP_0185599028 /NCGR_PEP_ID=MMETSP0434-20130131/82409_1 /TAXON_ID=626734 ORGANISM="Favella taraikaensis, Strain Fe Narragansett Bay" /NCGR_SAMPLE_ID=MMETSP0434 /ASSEMBLY_ACC=CAM_ASM_000379 /LENGTH=160 /DNA_ID=CAMNT_0028228245 /DNA_START=123 /DNA_END=605 /DNA_ORIENTATION=-
MTFDGSVPLIGYYQKSALNQKSNLMGDIDMPEEKETGEAVEAAKDETYYPYLKQELNLHVLHDKTIYKNKSSFVPLIAHIMSHDPTLGTYNPIVYMSDFWHLMRDLVKVDTETLDRVKRVRNGEKQEGKEGMSEKEIEKLNFDGKVKLTWDNYGITYASY